MPDPRTAGDSRPPPTPLRAGGGFAMSDAMAKDPPAGVPMTLEPLVTRVLAPNASPYTYTGTQAHIVGTDDVAIIDPGPADPAHHDALMAAIAGRPVVAIVITHHHRDHSPGARALKAATGAPIVGAAPFALTDDGPRADDAFDPDYAPDRVMAEATAWRAPDGR